MNIHNTMPASEYWWNHLSSPQRDFIQSWFISHEPLILLKDVVKAAFARQQNIGWNRESGWPETIMRII